MTDAELVVDLTAQSTFCAASSQDDWDMVIEPRRRWFAVNFREIIDGRYLLLLLVRRDIVVVYKQTVLGPLWFIVQPALTTAMFVLVFGNIAQLSTDGRPRTLFYMCGIVLWSYFAESFKSTAATFSHNAEIFGKVYFSRVLIPLSKVISGLLKLAIQTTLFLAIYGYFLMHGSDVRPTRGLWLVPLLVALMAALALGCGMVASSLTNKYRDLTFLVQFGVQLLMYGTPIIYPMSCIPEKYRIYIALNPISHIVEAFKYAFLGAGDFTASGLCYAGCFTFGVLAMGILLFNKTEIGRAHV